MSTFNMWKIPVTSAPNQVLQVNLPIDGAILPLQLEIKFNTQAGYWVMNIEDQQGNFYATGIPLVPGIFPAANILQQYAYMQIGSAYIVPSGVNIDSDYPDSNSLGDVFELWWSDTPGFGATPLNIPSGYKEFQAQFTPNLLSQQGNLFQDLGTGAFYQMVLTYPLLGLSGAGANSYVSPPLVLTDLVTGLNYQIIVRSFTPGKPYLGKQVTSLPVSGVFLIQDSVSSNLYRLIMKNGLIGVESI